jgi:hypothetical protein
MSVVLSLGSEMAPGRVKIRMTEKPLDANDRSVEGCFLT